LNQDFSFHIHLDVCWSPKVINFGMHCICTPVDANSGKFWCVQLCNPVEKFVSAHAHHTYRHAETLTPHIFLLLLYVLLYSKIDEMYLLHSLIHVLHSYAILLGWCTVICTPFCWHVIKTWCAFRLTQGKYTGIDCELNTCQQHCVRNQEILRMESPHPENLKFDDDKDLITCIG